MIESALVVGGGIGGLAAATALALHGVSVTLVERAREIAEVGAGLQVSPNGLAVLLALGAEDALRGSGAVTARAVDLRDYRDGGLVARLDLTRLEDQRYLFVHRADLITVLHQRARALGVGITLGRRVVNIVPGPRPEAEFSDGTRATADLLVCADGLHSVGRPVIAGDAAPRFTGQVAWRAIVPANDPAPVATVTMGPGQHVVSYPLRRGEVMNLVAVEEREAWAEEGWQHRDDPDALRRAFADFGEPLRSLLAQVETVHLWGLFRHPVARNWVRGNAVLLGDAAHPTLPFLAQGANMALEDAWVLARVVAAGGDLTQFTELRRPRAERIVAAATGNAWKYHLRHGPLRRAAHLGLTLGSRVAPGLMMRQFDWLYRHDVTRAQ